MNRIQLLDLPLGECVSAPPRFSQLPASKKTRQAASQRFFVPLHYEPNYAYPLLIWLHGPTGGEGEISQVMPHISLRNYVGVAPRGAVTHAVRTSTGRPTYTWDQSIDCIDVAAADVLDCIESAKQRFHIAPQRVFLVGNDVGGTMALRLALSRPEHFAGVVSLGGALPHAHTPLAQVQRARRIPVLIAHCRDSNVYSTDDMCRDLRLFHSAGMTVTVRQYPCEQEVTTQMFADVNAWVMEQVAGAPEPCAIADDPTHLRLEDQN